VTYPRYDQRGKALQVNDLTSSLYLQYSRLGSLTESKGLGGHVTPGASGYETYVMDALGHRMQETRVGTTQPTLYEYDTYGRMQGAHPPDGYGYTNGSVPLYQDNVYDAAGNQEWFIQRNYAGGMVDATRSYYDGSQRLVATDRQTCVPEQIGMGTGNIPTYQCRSWNNLDNGNAGAFEWYRYDALGRRVLARTRRDHVCNNAACASTITRTVWDGDQLLYEIRAPGGNVPAATLEDDNAQGPFYGRVAYTHGPGIDQPLEIVRMGFPLNVAATYGLGTWNGPYPVIPYADWHGVMDGATTPTGMQIPCNTTPNLCTPGIWPGSTLGAFYEASAPADHQAWFGSLTTGKTDGSGLMYMRNRYYNPQTGTFTQPDPIGIAGGLNVYGFAAGDPVSYGDPYGLCPPPSACIAKVKEAAQRVVEFVESDTGRQLAACIEAGIFCSTPASGVQDGAVSADRMLGALGAVIPSVSDPKLRNIVRDLYKGVNAPVPIGTGSTADAIRSETPTGQPVGGRWHVEKGEGYLRGLQKWLGRTQGAGNRDAMVARSIADDLADAIRAARAAGRTR